MMQFRIGTVQVTNGSTAVVVSNVTAGAELVAIGHLFKTDRDGDAVYQIASRSPASGGSLTGLTLSAPFGGSSATGLFYQIVSDFTVSRGYPRPSQGDADAADWIAKALDGIDADISALLGTGTTLTLGTGGIVFRSASGITNDATNLYWDNTTKQLGIGRTPTHRLHVDVGTTTDGLRIDSSSGGSPRLELYDSTATVTLGSSAGSPFLHTDAATLEFRESGAPRLRLDAGRIVIGAISAGSASSGEVIIGNLKSLKGLNAAGTVSQALVSLNGSDQVVLAGDGNTIKIGTALVSIGTGAVATLGSVGGAGPSSTAQAAWEPFIDSTGAQAFRPVFK